MSLLNKAREYERQKREKIPDQQRPAYHMTPDAGWMNDPNGFSVYQGEYHLFYQNHPYSTQWGPMYWGHCRTRDFIRWERLPLALAPDQPYESGCFSGSALQLEDGKQLLMYTAHLEEMETQCIAIGDGRDYVKLPENPVIGDSLLPEGFSRADFRDPKVWKEADGFYAVIGGRKKADGNGAILLYHSEDGKTWEFVRVLAENDGSLGDMWECPDFFALQGQHVLITSPMNMFADGLEFHNGHGVLCILGHYDPDTHEFTREREDALEYGIDFYAPQTLLTPDGRRVMIAWMQSWDNYMTPPEFDWSGMMTIPRELEIRGGRLCQMPVRELENYRTDPVIYEQVRLVSGEERTLPGTAGRVADLVISVGGDYRTFLVKLAAGGRFHTDLIYDRTTKTLTFDRKYSGLGQDIIDRRSIPVEEKNGVLKLRILLDRYSVETFVNDGEQAMTNLIYTPQEADGISFVSEGDAVVSVEKYKLM